MSKPPWPTNDDPAPVVDTDGRAVVLDLGPGSRLGGKEVNSLSVDALSTLIEGAKANAGTRIAFGRYGEPREIYQGNLFAGRETDERRTIHMGIDVFCAAGTPVHAPFHGVVEAVANNTTELDYGPVLILRHIGTDSTPFFTLYGHLALGTLDRVEAGQQVSAGDMIARIGSPPHNGNWPPHLHLQLILDLLGLGVDFPGVAFSSQKEYWLSLSPSPAAFFADHDPRDLEYG